MDRRYPHYRPSMSNRVWGIICRDVDAYYARRRKFNAGGGEPCGERKVSIVADTGRIDADASMGTGRPDG